MLIIAIFRPDTKGLLGDIWYNTSLQVKFKCSIVIIAIFRADTKGSLRSIWYDIKMQEKLKCSSVIIAIFRADTKTALVGIWHNMKVQVKVKFSTVLIAIFRADTHKPLGGIWQENDVIDVETFKCSDCNFETGEGHSPEPYEETYNRDQHLKYPSVVSDQIPGVNGSYVQYVHTGSRYLGAQLVLGMTKSGPPSFCMDETAISETGYVSIVQGCHILRTEIS